MFDFFRRMKPARKTTRQTASSWKLQLEILEDRTVMSVIYPANNGFELPNLQSNTSGNYQYPLGVGGAVTLADQGGSGWTFSGLTGVADNGSDPNGNSFDVVNATNGNADGTMSSFGQAGLIQNDNSFTSFGPSVISQAITLAQPGNVSVTFAIEQRDTRGNNPIDVTFDNFDLGTYEALSGSSFNTVTTPSVFLTAGTHTLSFTGTNTQDADNTQFIDNVQVNFNRLLLNTIPNMSVNEGSTLTFTATANDSDPNATLAFSLDSAPTGATIDAHTGVFSWTPTDGPQSAQVTVRVSDNSSPVLSDTQTFTITVNNVPPTATFVNSGPVVFGSPASVSFANPFDPSGADTAAGFHYAYALDPSQLATATYANSSPNSSATFLFATAGDNTVYGRIIDKDDGYTPYQTTVTVNKATPAFSSLTSPTAIVGTNSTTLSGQISFGALVPTGTVTIALNGVSKSVAVKPDGTFSTSFATRKLGAGAYPISYSYGGDPNFNAVTGGGTLNVTYNVVARFDQSHRNRAGSTIAIQIELTNANGRDVSSSAPSITALGIASVHSPSVLLPVNPPNNFILVNGFYFSGGYWQYDLKTSKTLAPGTYFLFFTVAGDPLVHSVQFRIKNDCSATMGTELLNARIRLPFLLNALQRFSRVIEHHDNDRGDR